MAVNENGQLYFTFEDLKNDDLNKAFNRLMDFNSYLDLKLRQNHVNAMRGYIYGKHHRRYKRLLDLSNWVTEQVQELTLEMLINDWSA